jgi:hypothetical protein
MRKSEDHHKRSFTTGVPNMDKIEEESVDDNDDDESSHHRDVGKSRDSINGGNAKSENS